MYITVKITNAHLRGDTWHFKMNVPPDLQSHYEKTAHTVSLETKDGLEAKKIADVKTAFYRAEHKRLRMNAKGTAVIQSPSSDSPVDDPIDNHMKLGESVLEIETFALKGYLDRCEKTYKLLQDILLADDGLTEASLKNFSLVHLLKRGTNLYDLCEQVYAGKDLSNKRVRNATARKTINKLMEYMIAISDKMASTLGVSSKLSYSTNTSQATNQQSSPSTHSNAKPAPLLSEVLEGCISEKKRGIKTTNRLQTSTALLIEWYSDKPISFYTRERMKSFIDDCLLRTPPNRNKSKDWRDYPLISDGQKNVPSGCA